MKSPTRIMSVGGIDVLRIMESQMTWPKISRSYDPSTTNAKATLVKRINITERTIARPTFKEVLLYRTSHNSKTTLSSSSSLSRIVLRLSRLDLRMSSRIKKVAVRFLTYE